MNKLKYLLVICLACLWACDDDNVFSPEEQLLNDISLIEQYLSDNNLQATAYDNGLHISTQIQGTGAKPAFGNSVFCQYRGYLLDSTEFDSNDDSFDFVIGRGDVIQGWDAAFRELASGTTATVFIPSGLGYGNRRQGNIPPNSVLIFDVVLLDVR